MKKILLIIAMVLLASCMRDENIIAEVNGKPIMKNEFEMEYAVYKDINVQKFGEDLLKQVQESGMTLEEELQEGVLQKMILEKIISEDMIAQDYEITPEELEKTNIEYYEKLGGEEKAKEFIRKNGMTEEFFKESLKKAIYVDRHKSIVIGKLGISEEDIKNYFNTNSNKFQQIDCSYILLKNEQEALSVREQIQAGIAFEDLALAKSIDPQTAAKGGHLGWIKRGEYIKEFEEAAFALNVGEISDPIASDLGYYIIKVNDLKKDYQDLKDEVKTEYENKRYEEYLEKERDKADIRVYIDLEEGE